jgi:hypothetical protein
MAAKETAEAEVIQEFYFTAAEGAHGHDHITWRAHADAVGGGNNSPLHRIFVCVLLLRDGSTVTQSATFMVADQFDAVRGRGYARAAAIESLRKLLWAKAEQADGAVVLGAHALGMAPTEIRL